MNLIIDKELAAQLIENIKKQNGKLVIELLDKFHPADIAEFFSDELEPDEQYYLISLLDKEVAADVLLELEEGIRKNILKRFSAKEIADDVINEMDTDDAVDIISELSDRKKNAVIAEMEDQEHAKSIVELLRYDEDSAGGLMGKELVKVNKNQSIISAVKTMRRQAEELEKVYSIYVIDDEDKLLGTLSLKRLLATSSNAKVEEIYNDQVYSVKTYNTDQEVAKAMEKYDLYEIPVVDELMRLVGIITVDDVLDVIREEADENYQLAAGITQNVVADDSIWKLTKARLPWLLIGMFGGLGAASIISGFETALEKYTVLLMFVPLIQSSAGNVGIQSSAIVVQGLANGSVKGKLFNRLIKEFFLGLFNGLSMASIVLLILHFGFGTSILVSLTICIALVTVIVNAAIIGTFIPIFLNSKGMDPAVSTGPFITTSNDILGVFVYFLIAKTILGF